MHAVRLFTQGCASSTKQTYIVPSRVCQLFYDNDNENAPRVRDLNQQEAAKCSQRAVHKQYLTNFKDAQEWEKLKRQLCVRRKATVKREFWNKLPVLPLLHSTLLAIAFMNLHMLRFQCSKIHLSFYSQLTAGATERCESFLHYTNTGYNMQKFTQFSLLQNLPDKLGSRTKTE